VLNPEKNLMSIACTFAHLTLYCSHFTLGNPKKSLFNSIIHTYFRLFTLSQKTTNCYSLTHHTWKMSPHYHVNCTDFSSFHFFVRIKYQSMTRTCCGRLVVTWAEFQQSVTFHLPHNRFFSEPPMRTHNRLFSEPPTFGGM